MREQLAIRDGERLSFTATFDHISWSKSRYRGVAKQTVLLCDVRLEATGQQMTDHLWFKLTKGFQELRMVSGDRIAFDARVGSYTKGRYRRDKRTDYHLSYPTRARKLGKPGAAK